MFLIHTGLLVLISFVLTACATVELSRDKNTGTVFRDSLQDGTTGPEMVWLPAGKFRMGSVNGDDDAEDDEFPVHNSSIPQVFAMAKYETKVSEFLRFIEATNHQVESVSYGGCHAYKKLWKIHKEASWEDPFYSQGDNYPVVCVSWNDAVAYTQWLSLETGKQYRLPTEAEWEFAVRAGTKTSYWWGNEGDCKQARCNAYLYAWLTIESDVTGNYKPNPFGLYDMTGNVWEWVASEYEEKYNGEQIRQSNRGAEEGTRVMRGGSWYNREVDLRSSNRARRPPNEPWSTVGFRVLREK